MRQRCNPCYVLHSGRSTHCCSQARAESHLATVCMGVQACTAEKNRLCVQVPAQ